MTWRQVSHHLEGVVWPLIETTGVKAALRDLRFYGIIPPCSDPGESWATPTALAVVRNALRFRTNLTARRRVALFVCSSDFAAAPAVGSLNGADGDEDDFYEVRGEAKLFCSGTNLSRSSPSHSVCVPADKQFATSVTRIPPHSGGGPGPRGCPPQSSPR